MVISYDSSNYAHEEEVVAKSSLLQGKDLQANNFNFSVNAGLKSDRNNQLFFSESVLKKIPFEYKNNNNNIDKSNDAINKSTLDQSRGDLLIGNNSSKNKNKNFNNYDNNRNLAKNVKNKKKILEKKEEKLSDYIFLKKKISRDEVNRINKDFHNKKNTHKKAFLSNQENCNVTAAGADQKEEMQSSKNNNFYRTDIVIEVKSAMHYEANAGNFIYFFNKNFTAKLNKNFRRRRRRR